MYRKWKIFEPFSENLTVGYTSREEGSQALHSGDKRDDVLKHREHLCAYVKTSFDSYSCAQQIHSANIHLVTPAEKGSGHNEYKDSLPETDALIVRDKGILINIHVADCVPIALYDRKRNIGALIHAGWKGTAGLISLKSALKMVEELNCSPEDMIVGIGPSISSCCYEIGEDTAEILSNSFSYSEEVISKQLNTFRADLKKANEEQLLSLGIPSHQIETSQICTSCSRSDFFSYRADQGRTGRFAAFMLLK